MYEDEFKKSCNQYHFTSKDELPRDDYQKASEEPKSEPVYSEPKATDNQNTTTYHTTTNNQRTTAYQSTYADASPVYTQSEKKSKKHGALKVIALLVAVAVISSCCGIGAAKFVLESQNKANETTINQSTREPVEVTVNEVDGKNEMTASEVYASTVNSVVSINCSSSSQNVFGQVTESASSGSGFIITEDGYILTNYHVVESATSISVTLYNGAEYPATMIGGDSDYDVAVIKIEASGLNTVTFGNSDELNVGDSVLAIGNPLGELTFSMSQGIVSCCDRAINVDGTPFNMIQIDCSVNPGNSGGPLMNLYGEVIGIVSAKYSTYSSTTVEGLGFAIPINDVQAILTDIIENGEVTNKAYLAIQGSTLTESLAAQYGIDITNGILVQAVTEGGAGEAAGIQVGDVITGIDGTTITSMADLSGAKKNYRAGDTATLTIYRNGETMELDIVFDAQPAVTGSAETNEDQNDQNSSGVPDTWEEFYDYFFGSGNGNNYGNNYGNGYGYGNR